MENKIFVRANPHINFEERYRYNTDIRESTFTELEGIEGKAKFELLYGYENGFGRDAIQDFKKQIKSDVSTGTEGIIGYLGIENHEKTSLKKELNLKWGIFPLTFPIDDIQNRVEKCEKCTKTCIYNVEEPSYIPVEIKAEFMDEEKKEEKLGSFNEKALLKFKIDCQIPKKLINKDTRLEIRYFFLEWPHVFSDIWRNEYDPENQRFEKKNIPMNKVEGDPDYEKYEKSIEIEVTDPSMLYNQFTLDGEVCIAIDGILLSETDIRFFGANGKEYDLGQLRKWGCAHLGTLIISKFSVDLEGIFRRKCYGPIRHLEFEGVIPEESRIEDITNILNDVGIQIRAPRGSFKSGGITLEGNKQIGAEEAEFVLWIKGKRSKTERMITLEGGYSGKAEIETGNLTVDLWGWHTDFRELTEHFNKIQNLLKERFGKIFVVG